MYRSDKCSGSGRSGNGLLSALILLLLIVVAGSTLGAPVEIIHSGPDRLEFSVHAGPVTFEKKVLRDGGLTLYKAHIDGFLNTGDPRQVELPSWSTWIVVPPGTRPVLTEVSTTWQDVEARPLLRVPVPVFFKGDDDDMILGQELLLPGEAPTRGRLAPEFETYLAPQGFKGTQPPVSLGDVVVWRNRRIAPLVVKPLQADATGLSRRSLQASQWRISFEPLGGAKATAPTRKSHVNDQRFGAMFLNRDILDRIASEGPVGPAAKTLKSRLDPVSLLAPEIRLPIQKTGFYRIDASKLVGSLLLPNIDLQKDQVRLYQRRYVGGPSVYATIEVPIRIFGDGDDFGGDDYFIFRGLRPRDDLAFMDVDGESYADGDDTNEIYNPCDSDDVNNGLIYYLAFGDPPSGHTWARMQNDVLPPASGTPPASYRRVEYREEDAAYQYSPINSTSDRNHWNGTFKRLSVPVHLSSPVAGGAAARLRVGALSANATSVDFSVFLYNAANDTIFKANQLMTHSGFVFDSGETLEFAGEDAWTLRFVKTANPNTDVMFGYLDWYELSYNALYLAQGDRLTFHGGDSVGAAPVEVSGFSRTDLTLFDVSDDRAPRYVDLGATNIVTDGDYYKLSLQSTQDLPGARRFEVLPGADGLGVQEFVYFRASLINNPVDPTDVSAEPDVIALTHPAFMEQAQRWAEYRRTEASEPLDIHIVDVHTLYDWYGGGLKTPEAIRRFTLQAITEWNSWALQIFGDANENARGLGVLVFDERDWVPAHYHLWQGSQYTAPNELLPSDKWFVIPESVGIYPEVLDFAPGMLVGRFPGNSPEEIDVMIDKVITFEQEDTGAAWKRRAIMLADDAWSGDDPLDGVTHYSSWEEDFEEYEAVIAQEWEDHMCPDGNCPDETLLESVRIFLGDYLDGYVPEGASFRSWELFEDYAEADVLPGLLTAVSSGAAFFHYQGHANSTKLAHEILLEDVTSPRDDFREDIKNFNNDGKPWIFMGLACHISAFTEDMADSRPRDRLCLSEKFLLKENSGACSVYASSGYEYINSNAFYSTLQFTKWMAEPSRGTVSGMLGNSKWVLGDMLLQSEMALLAEGLKYRGMAAQYCLLGDALLIVDTGPPAVTVLKDGTAILDGGDLLSDTADNMCALEISAMDEAGIEKLEIIDSTQEDLTKSAVVRDAAKDDSDRFATWDVTLPIRPFAHDIQIHVYDTADVTDDDTHFEMTLHVPMDVVLNLDGSEFIPGETPLAFGTPLDFSGHVYSGAYLDPNADMMLISETQSLSGTSVTRSDSHNIELAFTITIMENTASSVILKIGEFETEFVIVADESSERFGITDLYCFPNPAADETRILFNTDTKPSSGRVLIYSIAGDLVSDQDFTASRFMNDEQAIVPWDLLDRQKDELANGTYLYRVELNTTSGVVSSEIQRLVIMR
jgi:peptidase C25-like protein